MAVRNTKIIACLMVCMMLGVPALAERPAISWGELAPPQSAIDDPFADLSNEHLNALRKILRYETAKDKSSSYITSEDADELRRQLSDEGLDVDWLFQQRDIVMQEYREQSTAVNHDIIGAAVRIPGYMLPLEFDGQKVTSFLLVPYAGACIHTPPPPANQMVHVTYADGIEVAGLFTPVWIEGTMNAEFMVQDVGFSDGRSRVEVGYGMSAEKVYLY